MPATGKTAGRGRKKILITALLLIGLMLGLAACRGFFGQAPIALLTINKPANDNEPPVTVNFDISQSNDPDGNIATYDLDYGDGSAHATGTDVTDALSHTYTASGAFTVTLTVTDGDGRIGMTTGTVTIGPAMITYATDNTTTTKYDIWRMVADGTEAAAVVNTSNDELFPDLVKGTRDTIAYAADDGTTWNIWKIGTAGSGKTQLTTQTDSNQIQPSWSHDAAKIAYASNADTTQTPSATTWRIYTMDPAVPDSGTVLITQTSSWAPVYSPVSNDMVFVSSVKHDGTATAGGSAIIKRTAAGVLSTLYDSAGNDGDASSGVTVSTALNLPGAGISRPAWSPDGTKIAFSTDKDGPINIYVMDADGSNVKTLEDYVDAEYGVTNTDITTTDDEFSPYWLEDGSGLVFAKDHGGVVNLYKVLFIASGADPVGTVVQLTDSTTYNSTMPAAKR